MRIRLPSSRGSLRIRLSIFDAVWAFVAPVLALYFRGAPILTLDDAVTVAIYCAVSGSISLVAFSAFRLRDGMTRHFSVPDAIDVAKAVVCAGLLTYAVMFTFTRLDGIPRSTPIIHVLVLGAGLVGARTFARLFETVGSKGVAASAMQQSKSS